MATIQTIQDEMFNLPAAKRVRRSELYSPTSSPPPTPPSPSLEAAYRTQLAEIYGFSSPSPVQAVSTTSDHAPEAEFEFRLFSSATPHAVLLQPENTDGDEEGEGGFVIRERPDCEQYHFARKAKGERKRCFEVIALSGEEVLRRKGGRAWGLEVPWRVSVVRVFGRQRKGLAGGMEGRESSGERKGNKPGKKRRILLRERKRKSERIREEREKEMEVKEREEQEKRVKRNREKKVKRRMREKTKKAGGGGSVGVVENGETGTLVEAAGD